MQPVLLNPSLKRLQHNDPAILASLNPFHIEKKDQMTKTYWVSTYRSISDAEKLAAYAKLAGPALTGAGGRFLARGEPAAAFELGLKQRCVLIEFDSVEQAVAAHDSPAYQVALDALGDGAERDIRIIEGV